MSKKTEGSVAVADKPARRTIPTKTVGEPPSKTKAVTVTVKTRGQGLRLVVWADYEAVLSAVDAAIQPFGEPK